MGKRYASELANLEKTYAWATRQDVELLQNALSETGSCPLLAVGSGGSFSAAHFAAFLHEESTGQLAKAATPLDAISRGSLKGISVLLLSAGGKNPDIIGAFQRIVRREPKRFVVLCAARYSVLSELARSYRYVDSTSFVTPAGKDGFLATNTLLAFAVLLLRAYGAAFRVSSGLPPSLKDFVHPRESDAEYGSSIRRICGELWNRETLIVLHGRSTHAGAIDVESKFSEAALGQIQLADYRNFAHGRHNWVAKRPDSTGILAFIAREDNELAERTLRLIPRNVPVARIKIPHSGGRAALAALFAALHVVGQAGEAHGVDPGRPRIPLFGRRIYNLKIWPSTRGALVQDSEPRTTAIERKTGIPSPRLPEREADWWMKSYADFVLKLQSCHFGSIVFDYDGTLCSAHDRFAGLRPEMSVFLNRFLSAGMAIGIATGRGKSVKQDLRRHIHKQFWPLVLIAYYNGADVGLLGDDSQPNSTDIPSDELATVADAIRHVTRILDRMEVLIERDVQLCRQDLLRVESMVVPKLFQYFPCFGAGASHQGVE